MTQCVMCGGKTVRMFGGWMDAVFVTRLLERVTSSGRLSLARRWYSVHTVPSLESIVRFHRGSAPRANYTKRPASAKTPANKDSQLS